MWTVSRGVRCGSFAWDVVGRSETVVFPACSDFCEAGDGDSTPAGVSIIEYKRICWFIRFL